MSASAAQRLLPHEVHALEFLQHGPDCIGTIDSEEKLAAALVFGSLVSRGLVANAPTNDGPEFQITIKGRAALEATR